MPDELTLEVGDVVDILSKCTDGWWKVKLVFDLTILNFESK